MNPQPPGITFESSSDLMAGAPLREFLLIAGKDGVGKSSAIAALALFLSQVMAPTATMYVIDVENKFKAALASFGKDVPPNLKYIKTPTMNDVTEALAHIMDVHKPGDWLAVESMARVWERAQDLGYKAVVGLEKATYLERRREQTAQKLPVTPKPDELWSVTKGAHDGAFLDVLANADTLNVILSTTIARPPREAPNRKENQDRKDVRQEFGIDMGLEGAPRLPYYVQTLLLLDRKAGNVTCQVLRDNLSQREDPRVTFEVAGRKTFGYDFWANCR